MTGAKHTPGPWRVRGDGGRYQILGDHPGSNGKTFPAWVASARAGELADHTNEANARLIASAPALLEAPKDWLWEYEGWSQEELVKRANSGTIHNIQKSKRAIALAEGTQP